MLPGLLCPARFAEQLARRGRSSLQENALSELPGGAVLYAIPQLDLRCRAFCREKT